jgi:diketogulonate reductase-like aldo/keto reductase
MNLRRLCWLLSPPLFASFTDAAVPNVLIAPGVEMPMLAFGSARTSYTDCAVKDALAQYLSVGGRHIDTADDYGTQPDVALAIKASGIPRDQIFLTTKIPGPIGKSAVIDKILNTAIPQLQVQYIDLVLIHWPCKNESDFPNSCGSNDRAERLDTWAGLIELRSQGKIRAIGVSNYLAEHVMEVMEQFSEAPAVNQVQWHLAYHNETLKSAMDLVGTTLEAWASLGGPTARKVPKIPLDDPRLKELASSYNVSTPQVVLRWETQRGIVPVTATCDRNHALSDLATFTFNLTNEDLDKLDAMQPTPMSAVGVYV